MNRHTFSNSAHAADAFGLRITARLAQSTDELPHDITERLRAARVHAVEKRKQVLLEYSTPVLSNTHSGMLTASLPGSHSGWWNRLGGAGLLLILTAGLIVISAVQDDLRARELADIDAAILMDDLPPAAYIDAGFAQFLKNTSLQEP